MTKPFIQNVSFAALETGRHTNPGTNAILIQIGDPGSEHPVPKQTFNEVHQFQFHDIDRDIDGYVVMTTDDAKQIVDVLKHGLEYGLNVIVNCHAGLCRSGAVAEIGVMMGYEDTKVPRMPNVEVKNKLRYMALYDTSYEKTDV